MPDSDDFNEQSLIAAIKEMQTLERDKGKVLSIRPTHVLWIEGDHAR